MAPCWNKKAIVSKPSNLNKNKELKIKKIEKIKRAQVQDAIGWMLVAADRYPGLSVRTRNA